MQHDKSTLVIYHTRKYDSFRKLEGNREVDEQHVNELMTLIGEKDLRLPIVVNENMEVVDGQHTLEAARRLKKPVYYVVRSGAGLNEVQSLNLHQKSWTIRDFARSFADRGDESYKKYLEFRSRFGTNHMVTVQILTGKDERNITQKFKRGQFEIRDWDEAIRIGEFFLRTFEHYPKGKSRSFGLAVLRLLKHPNFDQDRFLDQLKKYNKRFTAMASVDDTIAEIESLYNYQRAKKHKVILRGPQ